ncbi:MAG: hypothetical protein MRECE_36c005 [Mycoplasmataceae bacterium CE_OT135]|nr:MAG: hypothetical protein MRECE_36c005 [Mycoplasmataceae bacterium CE_OT135]
MNSTLFKLTKNKAERIETIPLEGKEKTIKEIFQNNFSKIFPLILLQSEYTIQHGEQKGKRIDDLAFSKDNQTFYLIEYKSEVNRGVIEQALTYWNACQEEANRYHLRDVWNKYLRKQGKKDWELRNFAWDDMKIICISPEFTNFQQGAEDKKRISLVKITKYQNGTFQLESKDAELFKKKKKTIEKPNDLEKLLDSLKANEWVRKKVLSINELMANLFGESLKWNVVWKNYILYKREKGNKNDYLLGISVRQKFFWIVCQTNQITENWKENKDWPKQLNREIKLDNKENYQKIVNSYLKLVKDTIH